MRNGTPLASARMRSIGKGGRGRPAWVALAGFVGLVIGPTSARADEPIAPSEPHVMSEVAEVTSVVDAFDKDDPFDLNLTLGFEQSWKHASIRRESTLNQVGLSTGAFTAATENVASYNQSISTLNVGADIGLWRDLALIIRLPVILANSQSLGFLSGSSYPQQLLQDSNGQQIFSVPFNSPTRSGVDYFSVGADWAIFNQQRDPTKPTWLVGLEGRFGVGSPMHACNANAAIQCPDPVHPTEASANRSPGIGRGMDGISARTIFSRRFGYVEPYTGLWILAEFPESGTDYSATAGSQGDLENHPPLVGQYFMGLEVIPYERREQFQRFILDFRAMGMYHSEGRDYTELFDALGSTQSGILRAPNPGGYHTGVGGTSVASSAFPAVYFTGITDQLQYVSVGASVGATWQAGEYVKFNAGLGLQYNQDHVITADQACNASVSAGPGSAGPCKTGGGPVNFGGFNVTGIPNPNYRPTLDVPGNRFLSDDGTIVNLWINGVVMF